MKKSLWIFATLALFFAGDRLGGFILNKAVEKSQFRYSRLYTGRADSDILLLGNSRGLIFYQPTIEKITGKNTLNLSYNGLPINLARVFVQDYLERYDAPENLIIDISMCDRWNKQLTTGFNFYTPYSVRLSKLLLHNDATSYYAAQLSHLYRHNSEIFQRALFYLNKSDEDWLLDRTINDFMQKNVVYEKPYNIGFEPEMMTQLKELVQAAQSKNVQVHLLINPYYPPFAEKIKNLEDLKKAAEEATGLLVHNYATFLKAPNGFADYQHLNKYGSELFLKQLKKDGIL